MKRTNTKKPRARTEGLVIETLPDETLVYDLNRDKAHCLNQTASLVWRCCDGRKTTKQIALAVSSELNQPIDERFVWLALDQLGRTNLLMDGAPASPISGLSRREVIRALAISAAVAVPVVATIVAPTPAQAVSGCTPAGGSCSSSIECCPGLVCNGGFCGPNNP